MLQVFVDESGNLGQNEGYFIIAMVMAHDPKRLKNIIKSFCAMHGLAEAHATTLDFTQKQFLINALTKQQDYSVSYIIADKMMIQQNDLFRSNNLLFNYLFKFLIRDTIRANTDDIQVYVDNRNLKVASVHSLRDYIRIEAITNWGFTHDLSILYKDSKECKTLQIADLVASCVYRKYVWGQPDFYNRLNIVKAIQFPRQTFRPSLPVYGLPKP